MGAKSSTPLKTTLSMVAFAARVINDHIPVHFIGGCEENLTFADLFQYLHELFRILFLWQQSHGRPVAGW
jgi:hypothetical protein